MDTLRVAKHIKRSLRAVHVSLTVVHLAGQEEREREGEGFETRLAGLKAKVC